jgi:ribonuclease P protein component
VVSVRAPNGSTDPPADRGKAAGFPRSGRLIRHADFERVYKLGKRHFAAHLTVFYLLRVKSQGQEQKQPQNHEQRQELRPGLRVGFTVGRVLGGAVDRNRMKRRLREAVRQHWQSVNAAADVVINPKKSLLRAEFAELLQEIEKAFSVIQQKLGAERQGRH